jgi:hypothetical protein
MSNTTIVKQRGHSTEPPCHCPKCIAATQQADQRRAEIETILRRLDEAERLVREVAQNG